METMKNDMNDDNIDFGNDADVVPPADPAFDAWIARTAPGLNAPKATPRAEMWEAIQAARQTSRDAQAGQVGGVTPIRRSPWRLMSVIAAALLLGVAIDRVALRQAEGPSVPVASVPPAVQDSTDPSRLYRMAAAQTLTQAEALLTAYRASGVPQRDPAGARQLGSWGREVLGSTRLLIDSPAGNDPQLRALLSDLELVLVQIIQVSGVQLDPGERALIDRALEEKDLLPRIRTAVPSGAVAGVVSASSD
jgi:hypothetical protein